MPWHRTVYWLVLASLTAGCASPPATSITSAPSGPLVMSIYDRSPTAQGQPQPQPQAVLWATQVQAVATTSSQVEFGPCRVRVLHSPAGGLELRANAGTWHREGPVVLRVQGRLSIAGHIEGSDSVALAEAAWLDRHGGLLHLEGLRLWTRGGTRVRLARLAAVGNDGRLRLEDADEREVSPSEQAEFNAVPAPAPANQWQQMIESAGAPNP